MASLTLSISEEDKTALQTAAAEAGMPVGKYVMSIMDKAFTPVILERVDGDEAVKAAIPSRRTFTNFAQDHNGVAALVNAALSANRRVEAVFPLTGMDTHGYYVVTSGVS